MTVSQHRTQRALVLTALVIALTACGSSDATSRSAPVVPFDLHRHLTAPDAAALTAVSAQVATRPKVLSHGDGMVSEPAHPIHFSDPATKRAFTKQFATATRTARHYASARAAAADGYVLASYFIPQFGVHWVKWSLVTKPFDPAHPAMLLYDGDGPDAHLVGLSYYVRTTADAAPEGFAGANDEWHRHFGDCYGGGFVIGEGIADADVCTKIGQARDAGAVHAPVGTPEETDDIQRYLTSHPEPAPRPSFTSNLVAGNDLWMLHVWNVAGHPNRWGTFATANPALRRCTGACRSATT